MFHAYLHGFQYNSSNLKVIVMWNIVHNKQIVKLFYKVIYNNKILSYSIILHDLILTKLSWSKRKLLNPSTYCTLLLKTLWLTRSWQILDDRELTSFGEELENLLTENCFWKGTVQTLALILFTIGLLKKLFNSLKIMQAGPVLNAYKVLFRINVEKSRKSLIIVQSS